MVRGEHLLSTSALPWWHPERHRDRLPLLRARMAIAAAVRAYFADRGFVEVEPGLAQRSPGNEMHLHAFAVDAIGPDLAVDRLYLHTSPEQAMKKLLAASERRIFALTPCFRNRERGALHTPEFTMLEWYRAEEPVEAVMQDAAALLSLACRTTGQRLVSWRGVAANPHAIPVRISVATAFSRLAGIDLLATLGDDGPDRERLAHAASAAGFTVRHDDTWSDLFSRVLAARIEPTLGVSSPALLDGYPAAEAAMARALPGNPRLAERFELYCCGVELANGLGELTDPVRQRARLEAEMDARQARYGERYPIDDAFIAALAHMPEASGCAMGFDRVVMLATGAPSVESVRWTPFPDSDGA